MNTSEAEFYKKLRSTFSVEAHEHMRKISISLLELETALDPQKKRIIIETIHREFHSLKGAARSVDITDIETICHMLESIFSDIKKDILVISADMFDVFNRSLDVIEEILSLGMDDSLDISDLMLELSKIKENDVMKNIQLITKEVEIENKEEIIEKVSTDSREPNLNFSDYGMENIRVSKDKLDSLLLQGEEMLYAKLSIKERANEIRELKNLLEAWKKKNNIDDMDGLDKKIDSLLTSTMNDGQVVEIMLNRFMEDVKDLMLLPFSSILHIFPKMVRELSRSLGKDIEFTYSGTEFEIDRRILEEIKDPLIHMIRNSVDHGIESCEERKKLNKNIKGTISLNISQIGSGYVQISLSDDGMGIDIEKVKTKALENKLYSRSELDALTDNDIKMLIFKSGMSTKEIITDLSGRGLGLAIVREKIEKLEGSIKVESEKNRGTIFEIQLPISISTNRGIIIKVSKQKFVVPTAKVEKVVKINKDDIKVMENRSTITLDDYIIPIVKLKNILQIRDSNEDVDNKFISLLIINELDKRIAFSVDEIIIEQEVLVKQFNKQLTKVRNISGATILGTGEVVPILEVQDLIKSSLNGTVNSHEWKKIKEKIPKNQ